MVDYHQCLTRLCRSTKRLYKARTLPDLSIPPGLSTEAIRDKMSIPKILLKEKELSDFQDREPKESEKTSFKDLARNDDQIVVAEVSTLDDQHIIVVEAKI